MRKLSLALGLAGAAFLSNMAFGGVVIATANSFPSLVEGVSTINGVVGTFTDSDLTDPAGNYSATLIWGDGVTNTGVPVTSLGGGNFSVSGIHTYAEDGTYTFSMVVNDNDGSTGTGHSVETVADAALSPLSSPAILFSPGVLLNNIVVATFSDANSAGLASDFLAHISWGDGVTDTLAVSGNPSLFSITDSHIYNVGGTFTVSTSVTDDGGSTANFQTTAFSAPEPGSLALVAGGILLLARKRLRA